MRIRFGESLGEVNSNIQEKNATNDHGSRGHYTYGQCMTGNLGDKFKIVSVCDIDSEKIALAQKDWGIPDEACFLDADEFLNEKRSDTLVIATQDRDHVKMCVKALELGYDILLEKFSFAYLILDKGSLLSD